MFVWSWSLWNLLHCAVTPFPCDYNGAHFRIRLESLSRSLVRGSHISHTKCFVAFHLPSCCPQGSSQSALEIHAVVQVFSERLETAFSFSSGRRTVLPKQAEGSVHRSTTTLKSALLNCRNSSTFLKSLGSHTIWAPYPEFQPFGRANK